MSITSHYPTVVQFGAGSIGRGFVGQLWSEAGYEVVFVDVVPELLTALNERRSYRLRLAGPDRFETLTIAPVRAVDGRDREAVAGELARAAFACTAVGVGVLLQVAPALAAGLARRCAAGGGPLNVFLCENQLHCSDLLRGIVARHLADPAAGDTLGLVETVVSRMVPLMSAEERARDPLLAVAEDWRMLVADRSAVVGAPPDVPGVEYVSDYPGHVARKLFIHNMGHAVAAYLGYLRGHATIHEAIADPHVGLAVREAMAETCEALCRQYGWTREPVRAYAADLERRFRNAALGDTVARVGRDPLRKLRPNDRLVGAALLCLDHDVTPLQIARGIAAALRFDPPGDPSAGELQALLQQEGLDDVLERVCGLPPAGELAGMIRSAAEPLGL
ncbi:MAG: mannitol-1-phosphate 5-dehydrogenase [Armatimonadetes bacterium]|nr:mannitol-1-phosphate 5-dehydrogenase [Armatimonadota bacterium]